MQEKDSALTFQLKERERSTDHLNSIIQERDQTIKGLREELASNSEATSNEANNLKKTLAQLKD